MDKLRTRFAPSPTGFMHIGNLRSAIFGYLMVKHQGGDFILRIEDTDQTRKVEGAIDFIYHTCELCGIHFDEGPNNGGEYGPYVQSERLPLYKKYDFDREAAFIIAQTAMSAMCFIPWGIGMAYTSSSAGLSANELSKASVPWALCFIPAIVLQWVYFGIKHKKRVGTFGVVVENVEEETKEVEENPYGRPKLFWINFILFIVFMVGLGVFSLPPYLVFMVATVVTAMINYPKNFGEIFGKVGPMYLNIIVMLLAISVYQAVFNNTGMVGAISDGLIKICPKFMLEYIHIILLLLCVIIIYFIPFQIFNAMYPVFISIGAGFGIPAVTIIAPFVCNLSLATSSTPTNSSTYLGCALTETDVQHFCKKAVPVQTVTNAIVILLALIFGIV